MKICTIHGVAVRVHPLFPLILLLYILAGQTPIIAAGVLTLLLHEAGHLFVARRLSLPVSEIELTPFGGILQIPLGEGLCGWPAFRLAAAGIAVNLLCLLFCFLPFRVHLSPFLIYFASANATMLLVNLLPVLPLDGGRMLLAILSTRFKRSSVFRVLLQLGRLLAGCMLLYGLMLALKGFFRPFWAVCACYLLYAAALEERVGSARYLSALFSRRLRLAYGQALPVQYICAAGTLPLSMLLPQLNPRAYHIVVAVDSDTSEIQGMIDENTLYDAVTQTPGATIGQLLSPDIQK